MSMIFQEIVGVSAGGIVVPGYVALQMHEPLRLLGTFIVSFLTFGIIRILSNFMFIYGRRRLVLSILIGFVLGYLSRQAFVYQWLQLDLEMQAVGFIIPGLIANWMERQGVFKTLLCLLLVASSVRLLLMLMTGGEVLHV
ncbi:MAG: poly-gamma-glutamate biosynthesis protein PgsC [Calditrichaeota bacterium]|nr:poly-gamma-glutamate biosynthesis protein PgsC [Candidatus Cloacimonadota bacterium]MCA9786866.1 poly-gamma-glutamate biosynthesis protein PgsC [Candidatus Cloacimonadota bacterium]MCB1047494.1 poly-gamma-glutamate biosynthesis protein PgsC [Calditrichota bacterium]MCB9473522.1 poly-gamma-glutamate biosynthesis protein PgsC [Candidatus Delongbacteria bacterium]